MQTETLQTGMQEELSRQQDLKNMYRSHAHLSHLRHFGNTLRRMRYLR